MNQGYQQSKPLRKGNGPDYTVVIMWPLKIVSTPYWIGEPLGMNLGTMTIGKMILSNMDLGRIITMTPMIHIEEYNLLIRLKIMLRHWKITRDDP